MSEEEKRRAIARRSAQSVHGLGYLSAVAAQKATAEQERLAKLTDAERLAETTPYNDLVKQAKDLDFSLVILRRK